MDTSKLTDESLLFLADLVRAKTRRACRFETLCAERKSGGRITIPPGLLALEEAGLANVRRSTVPKKGDEPGWTAQITDTGLQVQSQLIGALRALASMDDPTRFRTAAV
jgi:hypothetical protein